MIWKDSIFILYKKYLDEMEYNNYILYTYLNNMFSYISYSKDKFLSNFLSSILGKMLDIIIINVQKEELGTSDLQFRYNSN